MRSTRFCQCPLSNGGARCGTRFCSGCVKSVVRSKPVSQPPHIEATPNPVSVRDEYRAALVELRAW